MNEYFLQDKKLFLSSFWNLKKNYLLEKSFFTGRLNCRLLQAAFADADAKGEKYFDVRRSPKHKTSLLTWLSFFHF